MIGESIKRQFEQAITTDPNDFKRLDVLWLQDEQFQPIGFFKEQLTEREQQLLKLLLQPWTPFPSADTPLEKSWHTWLFENISMAPPPSSSSTIRFIHFSLDESIDTFTDFHEAWRNQISGTLTLLWIDSLHGVVIQEGNEEDHDFSSFVQAIASDFFIDLSLLIGSACTVEQARDQFKWEQSCFKAGMPHVNAQHIFYEHQAVPYYLIQFIPEAERSYISSQVLTEEILTDVDMIKSISAYLHHHLNISSAAKSLHMHRNSLQYRIDKFIERTGIDIKQFPQAATMHFVLLLQDSMK